MVVKKTTWPLLQSCKHIKHQCYEANDRISRLPDDLLIIILSFLTIKEAARTSVLSRRWIYLWLYTPVLLIEDSSTMKKYRYFQCDFQDRSTFVKWANRAIEAHRGQCVDELRVIFDLNNGCQSDMDTWVLFAIAKQVKRLELNFSPPSVISKTYDLLRWRTSLHHPHNSSCNNYLRSLSLKFVKVTTKDIECLLRSCKVLENLCIHDSPIIKYVRACDSPLQLKHLEVSGCSSLKVIDILAPKLLSFKHIGKPVELRIRSASMLSKLSLGDKSYNNDVVTHAFDSLSKYFPQLEYLSLFMGLSHGATWASSVMCIQHNLGIKNPPAMKKLKHLELEVAALCDQSFLGWADLIEASPLLERLTLNFVYWDGKTSRKLMKRVGQPLKSLKTLVLYQEFGLPMDLEFITYIIENSVMLEDVIAEICPLQYNLSEYVSVEDQVANLRQIVPKGINFTSNLVWDT